MQEILIGSAEQGLTLSSDASDPIVQTLVARLRSDGLEAVRTVVHSYRSGFADLAEFFAQMAGEWRGWTGVKTWDSLEGDLSIESRYEHRHARLRVTLRADRPNWGSAGWYATAWFATAELTIDPGEQLSHIARDVAQLTRPWTGVTG